MSWICPDCGLSNSDQLVRCVCGYEGTEENEFEGVSDGNADSAKTDSKACPSCGKEVPAEDKFCSYCGKSTIDKEVILVFLTNYFLASIMFALFLWASRAPFPAMLTALCVYLAIMALNGILDPKTLFQGIIIKAIFVGALIAGIKASLVARNIAQA
ncbi:MAG: zinc ribbon domain-containing protein [Deltaproteobacteria bacterium]